jgi:peptidoglycan hydrolase CwlO-like protein
MAVLPESMDRLDVQDTEGSLSKVQDYIRYMGERIEFSFRNMTKTVSAAGVSSAELYILIQAQAQTLAALQSTVNSMAGSITTLQGSVTALQTAIAEIGTRLDGIDSSIADLDARVTALENPTTPE